MFTIEQIKAAITEAEQQLDTNKKHNVVLNRKIRVFRDELALLSGVQTIETTEVEFIADVEIDEVELAEREAIQNELPPIASPTQVISNDDPYELEETSKKLKASKGK